MNDLMKLDIQMTSLELAELTDKQHAHVMRDIRLEIEALGGSNASIFGLVNYTDAKGEKRPCYSFGKDGAMQLALKYDALTRRKVILKLEELEKPQIQIDSNFMFQIATQLLEKENQIALMKPKADFYDNVAGSKTAIQMSNVAKVLAVKGYGRNNLFEFLRSKSILQADNMPYQKFVDAGYFRVIEQKYNNKSNGQVEISMKTLVYQKGLDYIRKLLTA